MIFESPMFWAVLGVVLLIAEFFTLAFVLVFFGAAALIVSALTAEGSVQGLPEQLAWFSRVSVLSLVSLRRYLSRWFKGSVLPGSQREDDTGLLNRRAGVASPFVNGAGKVLVGGTRWDAVSDTMLEAGDIVTVTGRSGITLAVEPMNTPDRV